MRRDPQSTRLPLPTLSRSRRLALVGAEFHYVKFYRGPTEALNGNAVRGIRADRLDDGGISGFKTERIRG
jgi:hypothetical protein